MNCAKCGKEIPDGDKKICDDCQKKLLTELEEDEKKENIEVEPEKKTRKKVEKKVEDNNSEDVKEEKKSYKKEKKEDIDNVQENVEEAVTGSIESENTKKTGKKIKILVILAIIVFLVIVAIVSIFLFGSKNGISTCKFVNNKVGNTIANISNYGYTAEQGGIIYYIAPTKDGQQMAIYKTDKSDVNPQEIVKVEGDILSLNVLKDYIYYIELSDEEIEQSSTIAANSENSDILNNKIYRVKTDGTGLEVINSNEFHDKCYEIYVVKDKLYYIGVDANIWYMNLDGSEKTKLNNDKTGFLGITEDYIIFNVKKNQEKQGADSATAEYETCVMSLDGKNRKVLNGDRLYNVNIVDDYIYYIDANKAIYKVKTDGTNNVKITDEVQAYYLNIINNKILYMDFVEDKVVALFSMDLDGTNIKEVYRLENYSSFLNAVDNKVIFMDSNAEGASINMIDLDGSNKVSLYELKKRVGVENVVEETTNENSAATNTVTTEEKTIENVQ